MDANDAPDRAADGSELPDKLYFRIGEVASLVGVESHVLRYWETEFKMKPHRSTSGQRLYRKQDLTRFLRIRHLLHDEGYTVSGARKILAGEGAPTPSIDPERIRELLERVEAVRAGIRALRDELQSDR